MLKELATHAAGMVEVDPQRLLEALMERERLGTTAIGHGIAIPHARMAELKRLVAQGRLGANSGQGSDRSR